MNYVKRTERASRQYHHPLATDAHFPLTPALSLREREGPVRRAETPCACSKIERWKSCTLSLRERAGVRGKEMLLRPLTGGTDEMANRGVVESQCKAGRHRESWP